MDYISIIVGDGVQKKSAFAYLDCNPYLNKTFNLALIDVVNQMQQRPQIITLYSEKTILLKLLLYW